MKKIVLLAGLMLLARLGTSQQLDTTYSGTASRVYPSSSYRAYYKQGEVQLGIRFAPGLAFNTAEGDGVSGEIANQVPGFGIPSNGRHSRTSRLLIPMIPTARS
jgi:hypothetical protein